MSSIPRDIETTPRFGAPACDAPLVLAALAPADAPLPLPPRGCRWIAHDGVAALACASTDRAGALRRHALWTVPGVTPIDPQPVSVDPAEAGQLLERQAVPLRRMLAQRAQCAEYRVTVRGAAQPADARLFATLAQDLADLSRNVRATPCGLLPVVEGHLLFALSLMLHNDCIAPLLALLDEAQQMARSQGLTLNVVGPDALRSFPATLSDRAELVLDDAAT